MADGSMEPEGCIVCLDELPTDIDAALKRGEDVALSMFGVSCFLAGHAAASMGMNPLHSLCPKHGKLAREALGFVALHGLAKKT